MTRAPDVDRLISQTVALYGRLDVLVNNAGIYPLFIAAGRDRPGVGAGVGRKSDRNPSLHAAGSAVDVSTL